jgi:hypothetical protein
MHPFSAAWQSSKSADSGAYDFLFVNCIGSLGPILTHKQAHATRIWIVYVFWPVIHVVSFHFLLQLELFLSSGTVCLSIYSLVAGIFGMNIPYTWNDNHGYMFKWVGRILLLVNLAPGYKLLLFGESFFFFFCIAQVVIVTGVFCASLFIVLMTYARHKGLVGSWTVPCSLRECLEILYRGSSFSLPPSSLPYASLWRPRFGKAVQPADHGKFL